VLVTDELPVLPTGKVDKKLLRARYAAGTAADTTPAGGMAGSR
jgi:acyl-CoA synthetase (AMP-forming)/AMP-acid ligase II